MPLVSKIVSNEMNKKYIRKMSKYAYVCLNSFTFTFELRIYMNMLTG